jgi:MFS family permease
VSNPATDDLLQDASLPIAAKSAVLTPQFVALIIAGLGFFFAAGTTTPLLPRFVRGPLASGDVAVGVTGGVFAVGALIIRPTAGRLGDRYGRTIPMIIGGLLMAASLATYGLATNLAMLIASRFVTGIGEALFFVGAITLVNDLAPDDRRAEAVSYFSVAVYLGIGLGPFIGERLYDSVSFRTAFAVAGSFALIAAGLTSLLPRTIPPPPPPGAPKSPLIHRAALGPGSVLALGLIGFTGFALFVPLYVDRFDGVDVGGVFLLYAGLLLVCRVAGARIPDRYGSYRVATVALMLIAVGLVIMAAVASPAGLFVGTGILAIGMAFQYPALISLAVSKAPTHERSSVLSTFTGFFDLSSGIGGPILGLAAWSGGYRAAFAFGGVLALASLALLRWQAPAAS